MKSVEKNRNTYWQIIISFCIFFIMIFFLGISLFRVAGQEPSSIHVWSDISIMIILLPVLLIFPIALLILWLVIIFIYKSNHFLNMNFPKIGKKILMFSNKTRYVISLAIKPALSLESLLGIFKYWIR